MAAIYPLWFIYFGNPGQASALYAAAATAVVLAVVAGLLWVAIRLTRCRHVGAAALTVLVVAFFVYGPLHHLAVTISADPSWPFIVSDIFSLFASHVVLTLVMLTVCAVLILLVVKRVAPGSARLTVACNFAVTALFVMLLARFAMSSWEERDLQMASAQAGASDGRAMSVLGYNPDIYYIIVDGYARADVLSKYYDFDNSEYVAGLKSRGFKVNDSSQANYNWTVLSLASSLNYAYLQDIAAPILADEEAIRGRNGYDKVARLVRDNRAANFLRTRGYKFVHIRSSTPPTERNEYADEQVSCVGSLFDDEYLRTIVEVTWLQAAGAVATSDLADCHRQRLSSLQAQARQPGPKFVFAHFLPPHHPYLFDRNGNVLRHVTLSNQFDFQARLWEDRAAYLDQLIYMNHSILAAIDKILAESARPPVIIVQSDHGPNLRTGLSREEMLSVRFANFAAYLLPGADNPMPGNCAPVNQFRYLFNHYFDAGLPILPNTSYFSEYSAILKMREIVADSPTGKTS
ncbi:MAG TPA: sulfatase-like hydrolase/transferase [Steroidobacteraceae bacterium]